MQCTIDSQARIGLANRPRVRAHVLKVFVKRIVNVHNSDGVGSEEMVQGNVREAEL